MGNVNSLQRLKLTLRVPTLVLILFIPFSKNSKMLCFSILCLFPSILRLNTFYFTKKYSPPRPSKYLKRSKSVYFKKLNAKTECVLQIKGLIVLNIFSI